MKKVYSLIAGLMLFAGATQAQCTIDPSAQTTPGVNPGPNDLPCIERTVAYDQTLQGQVQSTFDTTIFSVEQVHVIVDSVRIDSITGAPAGINWVKNPDLLLGGENGCVRFSGTTTAPAGRYDLTAWGTAWLHIQGSGAFAFDTTRAVSGDLNEYSPFGNYWLDVIEQGAVCRATGINNFSAELNSALSVFPNPNNGIFQLNLNTGNRVNGDIRVIDVTGRLVYSEKIDVMGMYNTTIDVREFAKGIYTVQLRSQNGFASKSISVE